MSISSVPTLAMFLLLDEFQTFSGIKSGGASRHPDEGVCHFGPHILAMTSSSDTLLWTTSLTTLQFISNAQSFCFTLNTSMTMAATSPVDSVFGPESPKDYEVVSPLVAPPWCCLVMPAGCHIASCRPLATLSSSCRASWLLHRLSLPSSHCAALLSSCRVSLLSHHLSSSSCCATLSSLSPVLASVDTWTIYKKYII